MNFYIKPKSNYYGLERKMGTLELGLRIEVLWITITPH